MHESLVTIATFFNQTEFLLARARLESANIECFAQDENMLRIAGWHSHILGGMKLYTMNCAGCHGGLDNKPSLLAHSQYPPPPQLILEPLDDPEWHIFYAIRTGVRYSGMPAWNKALSEQDMWKVTAFLSRLDKLSPAVQEYWKKSFGVSPPASHEKSAHEHDKD